MVKILGLVICFHLAVSGAELFVGPIPVSGSGTFMSDSQEGDSRLSLTGSNGFDSVLVFAHPIALGKCCVFTPGVVPLPEGIDTGSACIDNICSGIFAWDLANLTIFDPNFEIPLAHASLIAGSVIETSFSLTGESFDTEVSQGTYLILLPVPEPTSVAFVATGLLALLLVRRVLRKKIVAVAAA